MRFVLVFALAFVGACGSSSVAVTSAPLEQDIASAPGPAPVQEPEAEAGCYCPEVTVRCGSQGAFHARMDRATCTLDLPMKACSLFGFEDGGTAHPEAILAASFDRDLDAADVFELCSTKHEAHHACDRSMDSACAFEVSAYDVSLECMRAFSTDPKVAHELEGIAAAREMNACLCTDTSCGTCADRCKSDHPAFVATCAQAEAVYCR